MEDENKRRMAELLAAKRGGKSQAQKGGADRAGRAKPPPPAPAKRERARRKV